VIAPAHTAKGQQRLFHRFVKHFERKWHARTVCGEGYFVASECGSQAPIAAG
jgi:hypothetical protein